MKKRHKLTLALSMAAGIAVLVAAALAAGGSLRPRPDTVVAPGPNQEQSAGGEEDPAERDEEAEVFFTERGNYYHVLRDCSGMVGARPGTLEEAKTLGKAPCPVCMGVRLVPGGEEEDADAAAPAPMPGEENARTDAGVGLESEEATASGVTPEPTALPWGEAWSEAESAASTLGPAGQPWEENVSMDMDEGWEPEEATASDVTPEPTAMPREEARAGAESAQAPTEVPTLAPDLPAMAVYYTVNGRYYHAAEDCSGMRNAAAHDLADALAAGKLRCPVCRPGGEPDHFALFRDALGAGIEELFPGYSYFGAGRPQPGALAWMLAKREEDVTHIIMPVYFYEDDDGVRMVLELTAQPGGVDPLANLLNQGCAGIVNVCSADLAALARASGRDFPGLDEASFTMLRLRYDGEDRLLELTQELAAEWASYRADWTPIDGGWELRSLGAEGDEAGAWILPEGTCVAQG